MNVEELILKILSIEPLDLTELADYCWERMHLPEREVLEAVQRLKYHGKVVRNHQWRMELTNV